jgi:PAS domain S-box-containing protein
MSDRLRSNALNLRFFGFGCIAGEPNDRPYRDQGVDASRATGDEQCITVTVDRDGIIHQWGDAVSEVVGHSATAALGRSLDLVIPPLLRPVHWWGFGWAMKRGRISGRIVRLPALRDDGGIVVVHAIIELIPGDGGEISGAAVRFVGTGAPWQGKAWQAALAPIDLAHRMRTRVTSHV